jgi:hypothetical protein
LVAIVTSTVMASMYLFASLASASGFPTCFNCQETARINKQRPTRAACPIYAPDAVIKFDCVKYECANSKYSWVTESKGTFCQWGNSDDGDCPPGRNCIYPTDLGPTPTGG